MFQGFFEEVENDLQKGISQPSHPFRYFTFATCEEDTPHQRLVRLRAVFNDFGILFFTDSRSKKVVQLKENNMVSCHFFHPGKFLQIIFRGKATLINDDTVLGQYWEREASKNPKDYSTALTPGTPLKENDSVEYLTKESFFSVVQIQPSEVEYLKINHPQHLRILFTKTETGWEERLLVP